MRAAYGRPALSRGWLRCSAAYGRPALLAGLVAGLLLFGLAGCSPGGDPERESARKGGSLSVALPYRPESLDPATAVSPTALRALWLVHSSPLGFARAGGQEGTALIPALARARPRIDRGGRRLTFSFRAGLRYSDGTVLRVADFERAVKRALVLHPRGLELLGQIRGAAGYARDPRVGRDIEGIDADERTRTVSIELTGPDPAFEPILALPLVAPVPAGYPARPTGRRGPPPGIGQYRLGRPRQGRAFTLVRDRGFDLPGVPDGNADEILGRVVADPQRATTAAIDGFIDASEGAAPVTLLPRIRSEYKDRYTEFPTLALDYLELDTSRAPFDDPDARRAVALSIDQLALARARDGLLVPTCQLIAAQVSGYQELDPCPFGERAGDSDLEQAQRLAERSAAGAPTVVVSAEGLIDHAPELERYMVSTLRKVGIGARRARGPADRRRAQLSVRRRLPPVPHPARYLDIDRSRLFQGRVGLQRVEGDPAAPENTDAWAELDREAVEAARVIPYGIETDGVLLSARLDATNCRRYSPVFGLDWSSLCLR